MTQGDVTRFAAVDADAQTGYFIRFVDDANRFPSVRECKRKLVAALRLAPGQHALELGCGTGDDAREMAAIVGPGGRVTGIDISEAMVAECRRRGGGPHGNVEFRQADAQRLPFPDGAFDACRTERVLMHVPDGAQAIREVARVLKAGGRFAAFDFDWDAVVVPHPDKALTRRITQAVCDGLKNGHIGRELPGLMRAAGLQDVEIVPHANVGAPIGFFRTIMEGAIEGIVQGGAITAQERDRWWRQIEDVDRRGDFFVAFNGFVVAGRKP